MVYYSKEKYSLSGYEKSHTKGKMYDAILTNKETNNTMRVPFGDSSMGNYQDKTRLNLYPCLIHGDTKRRKAFRSRFRGFLREGFHSPGWFSYFILW